MNTKKCIYCGCLLSDAVKSEEHIIPNSISGRIKSSEICCKSCNNYVNQKFDVAFSKIFIPIISRIPNLQRDRNTPIPGCTGKAFWGEDLYDVVIKYGKVVNCPDLSKKIKKGVKDEPLDIVAYDFKMDNQTFKQGLAKIAFNFALHCGVDFAFLSEGVFIEKNESLVKDVRFEFPIIPFVALTEVDCFLEFEVSPDIYHHLILFNCDKELWCYIDLFNTFQYYVLLSRSWTGNEICESFFQKVQKINKKVPPTYHPRRMKHLYLLSQAYGVENTQDVDELNRRIQNKVAKQSPIMDANDVFSDLLSNISIYFQSLPYERMIKCMQNICCYLDESERIKTETFRRLLVDYAGNKHFYPHLINNMALAGDLDIRKYTMSKFERLNQQLEVSNTP